MSQLGVVHDECQQTAGCRLKVYLKVIARRRKNTVDPAEDRYFVRPRTSKQREGNGCEILFRCRKAVFAGKECVPALAGIPESQITQGSKRVNAGIKPYSQVSRQQPVRNTRKTQKERDDVCSEASRTLSRHVRIFWAGRNYVRAGRRSADHSPIISCQFRCLSSCSLRIYSFSLSFN